MGEYCGQPSYGAADQGCCVVAGGAGAGASSRTSGSLLRAGVGGEEALHDDGGVEDRPGEVVAAVGVLSWKSCAGAWAAYVVAEPDGDWGARRDSGHCEDETLGLQVQHYGLGRGP